MPVRHIFLVHGVGHQKQGQFLADVVEPWVRFLNKELGTSSVRLEAELRPMEGPAHATITFGDELWQIWEVHWAESFYPLEKDRALMWGYSILWRHVRYMFKGMLPVLRGKPPYPVSNDSVYAERPMPRTAMISDYLFGFPATLLFFLVYVPALLIAAIFFAVSHLPLGVLSQKLQDASVALVNGFVTGPGDFAAILLNETQFAAIQGKLRTLLLEKLPTGCETATVIAHSGGTAVSYPVLADPITRQNLEAAKKYPESISFLTFGSSLNLAWRGNKDHKMWLNPLPDKVSWVDFWARYDPVSHGYPIPEMKETVRGSSGAGFEQVRVVNNDSPFSDHNSYWRNHPEVVSRTIFAILRSKPDQTRLWKAIQSGTEDIEGHRRRIGWVSLLNILSAAAVLSLIILPDILLQSKPIRGIGNAVLQFLIPEPQDGNGLWQHFLALQNVGLINWVVGAATLLGAGYIVWQMFRLLPIQSLLTRRYG